MINTAQEEITEKDFLFIINRVGHGCTDSPKLQSWLIGTEDAARECFELYKKGIKLSLLSSKEGSKAGFSLEDMRRCYEGVKQNVGTSIKQSDLPSFEEYIQSLTPPTSKVEAKPSQQEGEKKTMSIDKCKDEVARNHAFDNWNDFVTSCSRAEVLSSRIHKVFDEFITIYAKQFK